MRVKDLISELSKFDQDLEVLGFADDPDLVPPKHMFRLLDIDHIGMAIGERQRGEDQLPTFKFVQTPQSEGIVMIKLLAIF